MLAGSAFGWSRINHAFASHLVAAGAIEDPAAPLVVHCTTANIFQRIPHRRNVLFTMTESAYPAPWLTQGLRRADALIVPSEWNRAVFARVCDVPIYVVPIGTHIDFYVGINRPRPKRKAGGKFRVMWLGAHNQRKGWHEVLEAWKTFERDPSMVLYLKTTLNPGEREPIGVRGHGNVLIDNRIIPDTDLLKLYAEADFFVFPSWGEGWGMPLAEAMATGLPCATNLFSGVTEFCDPTVVYPLRFTQRLVQVHDTPSGVVHIEPMAVTDPASVVESIRWARQHWDSAQAMGRRGWNRMQTFGWPHVSQRLLDVLTDISAQQ